MDPLVRTTLGLQDLLFRGSAVALNLSLAVYLVCWAVDPPPAEWNVLAGIVLVLTTAYHMVRRLKQLTTNDLVRREWLLFSSLTTLTYAGVLHAPGALEGPFYPAVYALMIVAAAFARPVAALLVVGYAVLLEAGICYVALGHRDAERLWPHALFLGVFTFLNVALFRAEIARMRRLSRSRIRAEIEKMRDAARSYRLLAAPRSEQHREVGPGDAERLLRSSVDEIHQAVQFALELVKRTLGLNTALLLGLDRRGDTLVVQEAATDCEGVKTGPFSAKDGIFAAMISRAETIGVAGSRASAHAPYYATRPSIGSVCATPIFDAGEVTGVLIVDRKSNADFDDDEKQLLSAATHFIARAIENERVFGAMEQAKVEQGKLYRAAKALAAKTTEAEIIETGVSSAGDFASFDFAAVTLFDRSTRQHEICAVSGEKSSHLVGKRFSHNTGLVSMVVANRHALPYRGQYDHQRQVVFASDLAVSQRPSLLVLPLLVHERALGTLVLGASEPNAFGDDVRPALEILASHLAVSLANARMLKRLEEMATTDSMTGHYNKRALTAAAREKLKSAKRFQKPLSLLICDIDHFKKVNDTYGHDMGDVVIRGFGEVLRRAKRDTDIVGRFGGEEFVVVCEETADAGAQRLAERVRLEMSQMKFQTELGALSVTCSVGVATAPLAGDAWEPLFKAADEALYASKRGGRNRVTLWTTRLDGAA